MEIAENASLNLITEPKRPPKKLPKPRFNPKQLRIVKLLGDPTLSQQQIADIVGVSRWYVARLQRQIRAHSEPADVELEAYRRLARKRVPQERRISCLEELSDPEKCRQNPFSTLKAIEYVDTLLGMHPKARVEAQDEGNQSQPMFVLPAGANVQVNVIKMSPNREKLPDCDE